MLCYIKVKRIKSLDFTVKRHSAQIPGTATFLNKREDAIVLDWIFLKTLLELIVLKRPLIQLSKSQTA
jgi:hypothetical protein